MKGIKRAVTLESGISAINSRRLIRTDDNSWAISAVDFIRGPFLRENDTNTTITADTTAGTVNLTLSVASGANGFIGFESTHVGALFEISLARDAVADDGNFTSATEGPAVDAALGQEIDFFTHGTWTGTVKLQVSHDGGNIWEDVFVQASVNDANIELHITEDVSDAKYRAVMSSYTSGTCNYNLIVRADQEVVIISAG